MFTGFNFEGKIEKNKTKRLSQEVILSINEPEQIVQTLGGLSGENVLIKLRGDMYAVFKNYNDFEMKERNLQIRNERAAYLVSLFLGFNLVPPTVIRTLTDPENQTEQVGAMQQFIEGANIGASLPNKGKDHIDPDEIAKLGMFDFMIRNTDRHSSNYLIKDGKVFAIDHGLCFTSQVEGWDDNEPESPEVILSGEYYYTFNRANFFDHITFWNLELPLENREKLKAFRGSEKDQEIFLRLLKELLGERKAELFLYRINSIIDALDDKGKLNQQVLKEILGGIFEKHYT